MFKKCKVVMLSTNEKAHFGDIVLTPDTEKLIIFQHQNCTEVAQHLYITSDEEIKEGDWYYDSKNNKVSQAKSSYDGMKFIFKIIATTDKSITIPGYNSFDEDDIVNCYLPKPSQQFIEKYIEEYNKGNIITDVLVEYEEFIPNNGCNLNDGYHNGIKVNPKDNTITIKKVKDSWTKEEVSHLLNIAMATASAYGEKMNQKIADEWIKENL